MTFFQLRQLLTSAFDDDLSDDDDEESLVSPHDVSHTSNVLTPQQPTEYARSSSLSIRTLKFNHHLNQHSLW